MKKLLFIILLFPIVESFAQTPDYFEGDPEWCTSASEWDMPCVAYFDMVYYIDGEVILDGYTFKTLRKRGVETGNESCPWYYPFNFFVKHLRQDGEKIYAWENDTSVLMYDFGLSIGDTIPRGGNSGDITIFQDDYVVTDIDSLLLGGNYYKRFYFDMPSGSLNLLGDDYFIEGIGHFMGLLHFYDIALDGDHYTHSYARGDSVLFTFPENGPWCDFNVSINELTPPKKTLKIFPNPVNGTLYIDAPEDVQLDQFTIYSISGMKMKTCNSSCQSIDVSELQDGVYFLELIGKNGFQEVKRFVKQ